MAAARTDAVARLCPDSAVFSSFSNFFFFTFLRVFPWINTKITAEILLIYFILFVQIVFYPLYLLHCGSETMEFWFLYLPCTFVVIDNKADFDFDLTR